jgi:membrane-associated phospholipid phosphatase
MDTWLMDLIPWGYRILLEIQEWRTAGLNSFFLGVTAMGDAPFYIMLLPILYWCANKRVALGLTLAYLSSTYVNNMLKSILAIPRPGDSVLAPLLEQAGIDGRVQPLIGTHDPAWPSNHAQGSTVTWGYLASRVPGRWIWIVAGVLIALIAFSRLYLSVHYPQDVIAGILIGLVYLGLWIALEPGARARIGRWSFGIRVAAALLVPAAALALFSDLDSARLNGVIAGMGLGHLLQERWLGFSPRGFWWKRVLRAVVGLTLVGGGYVGLAALFPELETRSLDVILRAVRYGLVGLIGTLLAPWLFLRLRLVEREEAREGELEANS